MQLRNVNLNLLPILMALLTHRNVTRAAEAVGITQSTASKALAQLRAVLQDPLLVREGSHYVLSGVAERLLVKVNEACLSAEAVFANAAFDPATCDRTFQLLMPDYGALIILPAIRETLEREAPGIMLHFAGSAIYGLPPDTRADFFMLPGEWIAREDMTNIRSFLLIREELVHVKRRDREPTSRVTFTYETRGASHEPAVAQREERTADLPARVQVGQTSLLPILSTLLNATALTPRSVARLLMPLLPIEIDERVTLPRSTLDLYLCWHARFDHDPEHRWLRTALRRVFSAGEPLMSPPRSSHPLRPVA